MNSAAQLFTANGVSAPEAEHALPASHFFHLLRYVQAQGVAARSLLDGFAFEEKDLADPHLTVSIPTAIALVERARELTGEPALGAYLGLQTHSGEHGYLGFAAMCAPTLREALELMVRFAPIRTTAFVFTLEVAGPRAALVVEERADFGPARDVVLLALLLGLRHIATVNLGRESKKTVINLSMPEPAYHHRLRHIRPEIRFGRRTNELVFDAALLDAPLATADPVSLRLAREQCESMLASMSPRSRLVDQVGRCVLRTDGGQRSLQEIAALLEFSPRTLRRRLAEHGTTFHAVRDGELCSRAIVLLRSGDFSLTQIASRLGYANVANFVRAFRNWTGQSTSQYR